MIYIRSLIAGSILARDVLPYVDLPMDLLRVGSWTIILRVGVG